MLHLEDVFTVNESVWIIIIVTESRSWTNVARRKKKSSGRWRNERSRDVYAKEASKKGLRSRSYFKLQELDQKFHLIRNGRCIVDLGAAPGGWSQYASLRVGSSGLVVAIDILQMEPLNNVKIHQCDITSPDALTSIVDLLGGRSVNVVLSDMAPNISGNSAVDSRNFSLLHRRIFNVCEQLLAASGALVFKIFNDHNSVRLRSLCATAFSSSEFYKPRASRSRSSETYVVARGYNGGSLRIDWEV